MNSVLSDPDRIQGIRNRVRRAEFDDIGPDSDWLRSEAQKRLQLRQPTGAWKFDGSWTLEQELELTKICCLSSEIQDVLSDIEGAHEVIRTVGGDALSAVEQLRDRKSLSSIPLIKLFRQRLWAILFHANAIHRRGNHSRAKNLLQYCRERLEYFLPLCDRSHDEPSYGLRARLAYSLGQVHLHLGELAEARSEFMQAVENTMLRLEDKLKELDAAEDREAEERFAQYMIAKSYAFGLARVALSTGEIRRAQTTSSVGVALLAATKDRVQLAYARMVYAVSLRALFRPGEPDTRDHLERAKSALQQALDDFDELQSRHKSRAAYELATVYIGLSRTEHGDNGGTSNLDKAESILAEANGKSHLTPNRHAWADILRSRILRHQGRYEEASRKAEDVVENASENQRECRIAALIALGECLRERARQTSDAALHQKAEQALQKALSLTNPMSLNAATCRLQLIHCAIARADTNAAHKYMEDWRAFRPGFVMEHGYLLDLEAEAERGFRNLRPDFIRRADRIENYTWDELLNEFRFWLVDQWEQHPGGLDKGFQTLEVSRATIYNWKRERDEVRTEAARKAPER